MNRDEKIEIYKTKLETIAKYDNTLLPINNSNLLTHDQDNNIGKTNFFYIIEEHNTSFFKDDDIIKISNGDADIKVITIIANKSTFSPYVKDKHIIQELLNKDKEVTIAIDQKSLYFIYLLIKTTLTDKVQSEKLQNLTIQPLELKNKQI